MSIFNQIAFAVLITEVVVYLFTLIPLNFVPVSSRKAALQYVSKAMSGETVVWLGRVLVLIVGGVFLDTVSRLYRLDAHLHEKHDHSHGQIETTIEDLQYKVKLFYSQRNLYLSCMSLFMVVVLYRRMKDVYQLLQLQESEASNKTTIKALKDQVQILIGSAEKGSGDKAKPQEAKKEPETTEKKADPVPDPTESSGMRKRK